MPTLLDEVVITAPKQEKPQAPMYNVASGERGREFEAAEKRKAAIVLYRDNLWAPYPGLNCVFRGRRCPD